MLPAVGNKVYRLYSNFHPQGQDTAQSSLVPFYAWCKAIPVVLEDRNDFIPLNEAHTNIVVFMHIMCMLEVFLSFLLHSQENGVQRS